MKVTILIDNLSSGSLLSEWGLSIHIDYQGHQILLELEFQTVVSCHVGVGN